MNQQESLEFLQQCMDEIKIGRQKIKKGLNNFLKKCILKI